MPKLRELENTKWAGTSELWLDKAGNEAQTSTCTISIGANAIEYRWSRDGKEYDGKIALRDGGADFTDTFHSANPMALNALADTWAMFDAQGTWSAGEGPPWGWRITVSHKPTDELVLQMTIIKPWGEHGRAMRMICKRA